MKSKILSSFGEKVWLHLHFNDGFSFIALQDDKKAVGIISVHWRTLNQPLQRVREGYIDVIEVHKDFRRRGVASKLVDLTAKYARRQGVHQLRAWSSYDKVEALLMWRKLGFGLVSTVEEDSKVEGYYVTYPLGHR